MAASGKLVSSVGSGPVPAAYMLEQMYHVCTTGLLLNGHRWRYHKRTVAPKSLKERYNTLTLVILVHFADNTLVFLLKLNYEYRIFTLRYCYFN